MKTAYESALVDLQIDWQRVNSFEDSPELYQQFIALALENEFYATAVVSRKGFDTQRMHFMTGLEGDVVAAMETPQWPGTRIIGGTAKVVWFPVSYHTERAMRSVGKFWNWIQPDIPEDLCLWNSRLEWVVGSVAHEQMCFINLESQDAVRFQKILKEFKK